MRSPQAATKNSSHPDQPEKAHTHSNKDPAQPKKKKTPFFPSNLPLSTPHRWQHRTCLVLELLSLAQLGEAELRPLGREHQACPVQDLVQEGRTPL